MSPKQRTTEFNRTNILEAAKHLFITKGLTQTTMDDIAKEADYSKSTIYVYFKSKDEIYNYLILKHFEILKFGISNALKDNPDFADGFFAICNTLVSFQDEHPLFFESILGEIKISDDEKDDVLLQICRVGEEINELIMDFLRVNVKRKQINLEMSEFQIILTLWASIGAIILMADKKARYIEQAGITKDQFRKDAFTFLLNSIIGKEN